MKPFEICMSMHVDLKFTRDEWGFWMPSIGGVDLRENACATLEEAHQKAEDAIHNYAVEVMQIATKGAKQHPDFEED